MIGPNLRAELRLIVGLVLVGTFTALWGIHWELNLAMCWGGFLCGAGVGIYFDARRDDERLRRNTQRIARELVDKTTFAGFRRHE